MVGGVYGYGDCATSESYWSCISHSFGVTAGFEVLVFAVAVAIVRVENWIGGDLVFQARKVRQRHYRDCVFEMTLCRSWERPQKISQMTR